MTAAKMLVGLEALQGILSQERDRPGMGQEALSL